MTAVRATAAWQAAAAGLRAAPVAGAALVVLTLLLGTVPAGTAWLGKLLLDELTLGANADRRLVMLYAVAGAGAVAVGTVGGHVVTVLAYRFKQQSAALLNARLFGQMNRQVGLRQFENPAYQDRLRVAQDGASDAPDAVASFLTGTVQGLTTVAAYLGVVLALWSPLVVLVSVSTGLAIWAQMRLAGLYTAAAAAIASNDRRRSMYQFVMLSPRAAKEIRLYGLGGFFHERMMRALRRADRTNLALVERAAVVQTVLALVGGAIAAVGTVVVARRVLQDQATVGDVAFLTAAVVALQSGLSGIIESLGRVRHSLQLFDHFLAIERDADDLSTGRRPVPALRQQIEMRDVWFRYDDQGPWILRGVSLTVRHGETIGLVGLNGAGKSTLVKLLCRFYDPQRGTIRWDGVDLRDLDPAELRRRFGATYQDFMEFDLTARESVGIGDLSRIDDLRGIRRTARLAGVDDILHDLPQGYDTMLSRVFFEEGEQERGVVLSGGQWQRVALARSLMRHDADLLILDEPSAGLDPIAEHEVHDTLRRHRRDRTCLLISHRLSTLRGADRIVVLAGGRITEQGTHDQLMTADGDYADLFRLQGTGYQETPCPH